MATEIYCKSDCQFAQNSERRCRLTEIMLSQTDKFSPKFVCQQYVAAPVVDQRFGSMDINISLGGVDLVMKEKLSGSKNK